MATSEARRSVWLMPRTARRAAVRQRQVCPFCELRVLDQSVLVGFYARASHEACLVGVMSEMLGAATRAVGPSLVSPP